MISRLNYNQLKASGMMWEFHPECTGEYEHDKHIIDKNRREERDRRSARYLRSKTKQDLVRYCNRCSQPATIHATNPHPDNTSKEIYSWCAGCYNYYEHYV